MDQELTFTCETGETFKIGQDHNLVELDCVGSVSASEAIQLARIITAIARGAAKVKDRPNTHSVIQNADGAYWSKDHGWVAIMDYATRMTNRQADKFNLPAGGRIKRLT